MIPSIHGFFDQILNPNPSIHKCKANPRAKKVPAAQEPDQQVCNFLKKVKYWKLGYRAIQGKISVPLACWDFKEGIGIKTISFNTKKRENDGVLYRKFSTFLHHDSCIFHNFLCLIYVQCLILKLTVWFDEVFVQK